MVSSSLRRGKITCDCCLRIRRHRDTETRPLQYHMTGKGETGNIWDGASQGVSWFAVFEGGHRGTWRTCVHTRLGGLLGSSQDTIFVLFAFAIMLCINGLFSHNTHFLLAIIRTLWLHFSGTVFLHVSPMSLSTYLSAFAFLVHAVQYPTSKVPCSHLRHDR